MKKLFVASLAGLLLGSTGIAVAADIGVQ